MGPKWRTFVANMSIAIYFTMATCLLPWMAYFIADWKMLCIATSVPLLLVVVTPWIVPESARYVIYITVGLETLIPVNILKAKFLQIIYKYSVLTAYKTQYISITKVNQLIQLKNIQKNSTNLTIIRKSDNPALEESSPKTRSFAFYQKKKLHQ